MGLPFKLKGTALMRSDSTLDENEQALKGERWQSGGAEAGYGSATFDARFPGGGGRGDNWSIAYRGGAAPPQMKTRDSPF